MFFLFLLFNLISSKNDHFTIFTLDSDLTARFLGKSCNYQSCPSQVCSLLKNTSLSIGLLPLPLAKNVVCSKINDNRKTNIITFVLTFPNRTLTSPQACSDFSQCMTNACHTYDHTKDGIAVVFLGECLS